MARDDRAGTDGVEVPELAWLRRVVTGLALVMGLGVLAIAAVLWFRLSAPPLPVLPDMIVLPPGETAAAVTFARNWIVVVSETGEVLLYDRTGRLASRVAPEAADQD